VRRIRSVSGVSFFVHGRLVESGSECGRSGAHWGKGGALIVAIPAALVWTVAPCATICAKSPVFVYVKDALADPSPLAGVAARPTTRPSESNVLAMDRPAASVVDWRLPFGS
jgi:hypothetical protein